VLDIRPVSTLTDYFVIATADSDRQAQAMIDEIEKRMKAHQRLPMSVDGNTGSGCGVNGLWRRPRAYFQPRHARLLSARRTVE